MFFVGPNHGFSLSVAKDRYLRRLYKYPECAGVVEGSSSWKIGNSMSMLTDGGAGIGW